MKQYGEWRHSCNNMQRIFSEDTPWHVPWMTGVAPQVEEPPDDTIGRVVARNRRKHRLCPRYIIVRSPLKGFIFRASLCIWHYDI